MPSKPLEPHELDKIAIVTLAYYEQHAEEFRAGTRDQTSARTSPRYCDISKASRPSRFSILVAAGRDLKTLAGLGHIAIGLEGAAGFAAMRGPTPGAKCGSRISSSLPCRVTL